MADNLQLSTVQPDFEQISNQLSAYLADKAFVAILIQIQYRYPFNRSNGSHWSL